VSPATLFDSHLHLTAARFDEDRADVLAAARAAGVREMVTVASDPGDARRGIALAEAEEGVWATAGLHPHEAGRTGDCIISDIESLAAAEVVVAIGETGLDFHYDNSPRESQLFNFERHLELAEKVDLPIIVHARDADDDTARLIDLYAGRVTGVLHCFSAGPHLLEAGLEAGWYVSFSGLVTFVTDLAEAVRAVPGDRLLIETDAPYLAPVPRRGRRNEPALLPFTCARVAEIRGETPERTARTSRDNARRFYRIEEGAE